MKLLQNILLFIFLLTSIIGLSFSFYLYQENQDLKTELVVEKEKLVQEKVNLINFQRTQKNEIANLFDNQAALNDDLVDEQRRLIQSAERYINYVDASIRFIDGQPQILPVLNEEEMLNRKNTLVRTASDLERIAEENTNQKERYSKRISQLYLEAGEDRDNTTNDREGIRGE